MLKNKVIKNASWIVVCKIAQSLLGLIVGMFTARYLGPSNYGLISYAASITAFVVPVMNLGLSNIMVQEFVQQSEEDGKLLGTSLLLNFCSALLCIFGIIAFSLVANHGESATIIVCSLYSITLAVQALELIQYWFQAKLLSKYTSVVSLIAYVVVSSYKIFLLVAEKNIYWFAVSNAIDYLLIGIFSVAIYFWVGGQKLCFSKKTARRLFARSKYYIISSMMVTVFAQTDKIMLKLMLDDTATGYYTAAVTCAGITSFVFGAIIDSARPSIFGSQQAGMERFEKNMSRLYCIIIYLSLLQSLGMTCFAKIIISVLYGQSYESAVSALQIIVWYTTFSYLGSVRNIWMLAEEKQKYLWIINLSGATVNVLLNAWLIRIMGINGAALASLITQFFTNVLIGYVIKPIRRNNMIMLKGGNPGLLLEIARKIKG